MAFCGPTCAITCLGVVFAILFALVLSLFLCSVLQLQVCPRLDFSFWIENSCFLLVMSLGLQLQPAIDVFLVAKSCFFDRRLATSI